MKKTIRAAIIYGPTATGKTELGINMAKKFDAELISADSRQVYEGMDIGSGKTAFDSQVEKHKSFWIVDGVRINGFDLAEPEEKFTAADFIIHATNSINRLAKEKKVPIIVGGTGFYIKTLISGLGSIGIPANEKLRRQLENISVSRLYQKLQSVNPKRALSMNQSDRQNPRRLTRAIEIALSNKKLKIKKQKENENLKFKIENYFLVGLTASNDYLYLKSDNWLIERIKHGLVEEVESLIKSGISTEWLENLGLEYRWFTRYLSGQISKDEAINRLKGDTHNFIRRQKTYFKQFKSIEIFDIQTSHHKLKIKETFAQFINSDIY